MGQRDVKDVNTVRDVVKDVNNVKDVKAWIAGTGCWWVTICALKGGWNLEFSSPLGAPSWFPGLWTWQTRINVYAVG